MENKESILTCSEQDFRKRIIEVIKEQNILIKDLQNQVDEIIETSIDMSALQDKVNDLERAEQTRLMNEE